ncbi:MAG: menaquinone biosynthesis family protein [Candidatus Dormibacteria bacterium]
MTTTAVRRVRLGHSPDADDAFMFHGLASHQVGAPDIDFEHVLVDIQTLNEWAREGRLEITAISVHAYAHVADRYDVLRAGASMGDGYGPTVVTRQPATLESLAGGVIAVPGLLTSAYLALRLYLPDFEAVVVPFDQIMERVAAGEFDAGLLIHEGQLTHGQAGLQLVEDLGRRWKAETGLPLPLGINAVRRDLGDLAPRLARLLEQSIAYGLDHRQEALVYAAEYGRDTPGPLLDRFVGMYVNDWTLDMGADGERAIRLFLERGAAAGIVPQVPELRFV